MNLAVLEFVDHVIIDEDSTAIRNIMAIQPDFFAKGYEYVDGAIDPRTMEEMRTLESLHRAKIE